MRHYAILSEVVNDWSTNVEIMPFHKMADVAQAMIDNIVTIRKGVRVHTKKKTKIKKADKIEYAVRRVSKYPAGNKSRGAKRIVLYDTSVGLLVGDVFYELQPEDSGEPYIIHELNLKND